MNRGKKGAVIALALSLMFMFTGCRQQDDTPPPPPPKLEVIKNEAVTVEKQKLPTELRRTDLSLYSFDDGKVIFEVSRPASNPQSGVSKETVEIMVYDVYTQKMVAYKYLNMINGYVSSAIYHDDAFYYTMSYANYSGVYKMKGIETYEIIKDNRMYELVKTDEGVAYSYIFGDGENLDVVTKLIVGAGFRELSRDKVVPEKEEKHTAITDGARVTAVLDDFYVSEKYNGETYRYDNFVESREDKISTQLSADTIRDIKTDGEDFRIYLSYEDEEEKYYALDFHDEMVMVTPLDIDTDGYTCHTMVDDGDAFIMLLDEKRGRNLIYHYE